jgi:hypothetical protein
MALVGGKSRTDVLPLWVASGLSWRGKIGQKRSVAAVRNTLNEPQRRGQVEVGATRRTIVLGALAALAYYALLSLITADLPHIPVPAWWRQIWPSPSSAVQTWFGLMDAAGALFAALPVAAFLVWRIGGRAAAIGLATGVMVAAYILGSSFVEYGMNTNTLFVAVNQFVWVGLALPATSLMLMRGRGTRE